MPGIGRAPVRPWLRRTAIVAFVVLVPVAAHALWDYVEIRRLVREIDSIRNAGEPVSEGQAGRGYQKLSADEALAARYFMAAAALASSSIAEDHDALRRVSEYLAGHAPQPLDAAAVIGRLKPRVAEAALALELADRATALPFNGFAPGTSYSYRTQGLMALLWLQSVRTNYLALSGRGDEAAESAIRSIKSGPVVGELNGWRRPSHYDVSAVLSFTTPSAAVLRRLLDELRAGDRPDAVEKTVIGERASYLESALTALYGVDAHTLDAYGPRSRGFGQALYRPWLTHQLVSTLRGWTALVAASRQPWPQKGTEMAATYARFSNERRPPLPQLGLFFTVIPPRTFERLTLDRAAATAVAIALYRADHSGRLPAALDDLSPGYLTERPIDPATGDALKFKHDATSFAVYSVGSDGKDDGADLTSQLAEVDERGWGRRELRGRDLGIRVLNPPRSVDEPSAKPVR